MNKTFDIGIIGFGIAGATLAENFLRRGLRVCVFVSPHRLPVSSHATGLISPIAGMRFGILEEFHRWWSSAWDLYGTYDAIEPITCYRLLYGEDEHRWWERKKSLLQELSLADESKLPAHLSALIAPPSNVIIIKQAARISVKRFLERVAAHVLERGMLVKSTISDCDCMYSTDHIVSIKGIECGNLVFCEGVWVADNRLFNWIPRMFARGQRISGQFITQSEIPHPIWLSIRGKSLLLEGKYFSFGSTFDWNYIEPHVTDESTMYLKDQLSQVLRIGWHNDSACAGVRPIVADLQPVLGYHPAYMRYWIFNGLGSRGLLLAPFLARMMVNAILDGDPIPERWNVERFWSVPL